MCTVGAVLCYAPYSLRWLPPCLLSQLPRLFTCLPSQLPSLKACAQREQAVREAQEARDRDVEVVRAPKMPLAVTLRYNYHRPSPELAVTCYLGIALMMV